MKSINIGLLSAMPEEIGNTIDNLENVTSKEYGDLKIYQGRLKKKVTNYESVYIIFGLERMGESKCC